ncbi:MAG: Dihydrolipoamide acetyltransferase component of pyruvate dehydrogenase complex [uncultured Rubrobacteraceae bacterium]|uniref:Dihydrolipoamide acetyltransferase component of pyruvate dehydrogenase complex n=1 Tax=uncultured Rubrobacteraceae bacterium TaxID=349277 RepID=A0A6J4RAJ0_9ACTN|nr:MAG: Dihydrolipoamide acetyltransferase component of pyruvate dehydrogenase complex [uncultured Rubrobacteraceae bacterium]
MPEVIMPKMGDAMEEGTLLQWLKSEGEEVSEGDPIAEIETDKVTMELEAEDAGTLAQLIASEGQDVPVGEAIAFIQGEGEEVPEVSEGGGEAEDEAEEGGEEDGGGAQATATETGAPEEEETEEETGGQTDGRADGHFRASPIVRRLAEENDLDLAKIDGSGPAGRIVERDVRGAMESGTAQRTEDGAAQEDGVAAPEQAQPQQAEMQGFQPARLPEPTEEPGTQLVEPTRMMQVIGERMTEAQQHIPHFYATVEVRMDAAMALRKQLNEQLEEEGVKLSVNDFVMKACAVALRSYPNLNALYTTRGVELHEKVDMAMAVALDQGLITPVIRDIGSKGLAAISQESKDLATRARDGKLQPDEYQGGTITVSNMGMFGIESFTAIINPPQAAIVAVSSIAKRPDYDENGQVVPASMMKLTLSADHRIANGRDGALYMAEVKRVLENPVMLMV